MKHDFWGKLFFPQPYTALDLDRASKIILQRDMYHQPYLCCFFFVMINVLILDNLESLNIQSLQLIISCEILIFISFVNGYKPNLSIDINLIGSTLLLNKY